MIETIKKQFGGDRAIWAVVLLLAVLSVLVVYSSIVTLAYKYQDGNTFYYLLRHTIFVGIGFGIIYMIHRVKHKYFSRVAQIAVMIAIPLLAITLLAGNDINHAKRWLTIPVINQSFQTSDLAKLALIMYVARILAVRKDVLHDFQRGFLPLAIPIFLVVGLILPANLSTALLVFACCLVLMFIGRVPMKWISSMVGIAVCGAMMILLLGKAWPNAFPRFDTWASRIVTFTSDEADPDRDYQKDQAMIAIATGGITGKAPGNSTQRNFLPHPYSDFIFAIIVEEYGLIGGTGVVMLYLILLFRSIKIARGSPGTFGSFLVIGIVFTLVFQGMINMAVAVNLMPVTGQPLPMVSMGGTSIWFTCVAMGIVLSVSRSFDKETPTSTSNALKNATA